ncbi:MarR family transcriptional regulator [Streptomyces sp. CAU 1734]|uniref:GbsR/MarR family transcriptional regulator n=1 Tax=Streptomyces sp. CAU 1734 TaxID=3140360 RepID=UPI00326126BE
MPGDRLGHEDRRRIGAWLAEGFGYAEIARRLGRPTSTVSREVARNGGPGGYRPDHAHLATERRARRHRPVPDAEPEALTGAYGRDPGAVRAFTEAFAALMVRTGLPRMAARVFACLVTTDSGVLTAAELVRRLRVSPASVSKAIGYLETLEVVRRERDPRHRRERYIIDDDIWLRSWLTSARSNAGWAETARRGAELFHAATPAGARLAEMARFFAGLSEDMAGGGPATGAADDARTVLAALVHAGGALTPAELCAALEWSPERTAAALHTAGTFPSLTGPVVLRRTGRGGYRAAAAPERLTPGQLAALTGAVAGTDGPVRG